MSHTRKLLPAIVLAVALGLSACGANPTTGETSGSADSNATIEIGSTIEPTSLTRNVGGSSGISQTMLRNVYEGLTVLDTTGEVVPALAESWDVSQDGLSYTFHLRPSLAFHDGTPVTAKDAAWSLSQAIAPESKAARKSDLEVMTAITAPDDATVQVTLSRPSQSLTFYLAGITVVKDGDTQFTKENGTGPYVFSEWTQGDHLTITRNDKYWGTPAKNGEVIFRFFKDPTALNNALLTHAIDLVISEDSPDQLAQFENNPDFVITEGKSTTKQLWAFNDKAAPFNDVRVRQALYRAIDREALLKTVWTSYGEVIGSMVPPTDPWYSEDVLDFNAYDPAESKKLLAEAGVSDLTITLDYVSGDSEELISQALQADLKEVGVTLELNPIDDATWYQRIYTDHDFETTIMGHVNPRDVLWYANPNFYWGYDNAEVQAWVDAADRAPSAAEQTGYIRQVNEQIAKDAASAWLYLTPQIRVASNDITGYPHDQVVESFYVAEIVKSA